MTAKLGSPSVAWQQRHMGSKEFTDWKVYFRDIEPNEFNPIYQYLANIACKIVQVNVKRPGDFNLDQFILKFEPRKEIPPEKKKEKDLAARKATWWAALGLGRKKTAADKVLQAKNRRRFGLPVQSKELGDADSDTESSDD